MGINGDGGISAANPKGLPVVSPAPLAHAGRAAACPGDRGAHGAGIEVIGCDVTRRAVDPRAPLKFSA